jgi:4a-hydroxytetrahydrobiopterin dehydratase
MSRPASGTEFRAASGTADWRGLYDGATTNVPTGSADVTLELVGEILRATQRLGRQPDLDVRPDGVLVRTHTLGLGLSDDDFAVAQAVSEVVDRLGLTADPVVGQAVMITIDTHDIAAIRPFWQAVLGYDEAGDEDLVDPHGRGPQIWFQQMEPARTGRNRVHVDVMVAPEVAKARIAAAEAAGGRVTYDAYAPSWWTLTDPEGNEADIATWEGRG